AVSTLSRAAPFLLLAAFVACGDARTAEAQGAPPSTTPHQPAFRFPDEIAPAPPLTRPPRAISRPNEGTADAPQSPGSQPVAPSLWGTLGPLALIIVLILTAARVWRKHGPLVAQ